MASYQQGKNTIVYEVAVLMNDQNQTEYTNNVVSPFLSLALGELDDIFEESNVPITNIISPIFYVKAGESYLLDAPFYMMEIQELGERRAGSDDSFLLLPRKEFPDSFSPTNSLVSWSWLNGQIRFNTNGANVPMEVQLKYVGRPFGGSPTEDYKIFSSNAQMFLIYRTAGLCARFIAENETRAGMLDVLAEKSVERLVNITNKGRLQIMTRHRPFRARYKARGF
jgi:hypothetical protein